MTIHKLDYRAPSIPGWRRPPGRRPPREGRTAQLDYITINALTVLFPLLFSFDRRVRFFRKWRPLGGSILVVSPVFIAWDAVATARGDWWFNEHFVGGIELAGLPLEEVLFFVTVPYACVFIYECLLYYVGDRPLPFSRWPYLAVAALAVVLAVVYRDQYYTATLLAFCAGYLVLAALWYPDILRSSTYWLYMGVSLLPFFIVNNVLTSTPIVLYSPDAIWGARVTTIPVEDFFYNFALLSLYLLVYLVLKRRWRVDWGNEGAPVEVGTGRGLGPDRGDDREEPVPEPTTGPT